jgi:site-specific recombinase XerC
VAGGKILALASVCRNDPKPVEARGDAMLGVAFASGLRLSELVGLLADLNLETGELVVRGWFRPS